MSTPAYRQAGIVVLKGCPWKDNTILKILSFVVLLILVIATPAYCLQISPCDSAQILKQGESFNIVFCCLNYSDKESADKAVNLLGSALRQTEPFNEFEDRIRFWRVDLSMEEQRDLFKRVSSFPYLAVKKSLIAAAADQLKANYKLIIIDNIGATCAAEISSVDKTSLIVLGRLQYHEEKLFIRAFLHEVGHSLGLKDENWQNHAARCEPGYPNCARTIQEARAWWGDLAKTDPKRVGFYNGAGGNKEYIRPTIASLMNDIRKARDFGPVNERYIRQELGKVGRE